MVVPLSLKATVPLSGEGEIVAVKKTELPKMDGFCDDVSAIVVGVIVVKDNTAPEAVPTEF